MNYKVVIDMTVQTGHMRAMWARLSIFRRPTRGPLKLRSGGIAVTVSPDECDGGFVAQVDSFPGCVGQGETPLEAVEAAFEVLRDVVQLQVQSEVTDHSDAFDEPRRVQVVG